MVFETRFQVLTLPNRDWAAYRDQIVEIEELGFDVAAIPDHFCDWANPPAPWLECWTSLAGAASETSRIRLSTFVSQIPLRNPGVLAHQAVTVDHISSGRLELGLGTGLRIDPGSEMIGLPNWSNPERVARFGEYVRLVGLLLAQDVTTFDGEYYSTDGAVMNPSSLQRPRVPIMIAALGPKMLGHAAAEADIWNTMSFDPDFDTQIADLAERSRSMDGRCAAIGRDASTLRKSVNLFDATARTAGGRIRYYDDDDLFASLVRRFAEAGYTDFNLYYPSDPDQATGFERIAREVIPDLRASMA